MDPQSFISSPVGLVVLLALAAVFGFFLLRPRFGSALSLRPIAAYEMLTTLLSESVEEARPVHISIGVAGAGGASTVDTTAGLYALEFLADRSALAGVPPIVTVTDPTALPIAQQQLARGFREQGYSGEYDPAQTRFIAPPVNGSAVPYAAGVMDTVTHDRVAANVMIGAFGDEFLLMSEPGAQRDLPQVGGTSNTQALPFVYTSVTNPLIGEEIYAGGAYLHNRGTHIRSLFAQDTARVALVLVVLALVLLRIVMAVLFPTAGWGL